jgi:hypothetical protein
MDGTEREKKIFRSTISSNLLSDSLKKGGIYAGSGAVLILLAGTLFPLSLLKILGIPIFLTGLFLIGLGLIPYRKLTRLQLKTHEIHWDGKNILFCKEGKPLFKVNASSIEKISYRHDKNKYGICICLKYPVNEKMHILQPKIHLSPFINHKSCQKEKLVLFLPYFSRRTFDELKLVLAPELANH